MNRKFAFGVLASIIVAFPNVALAQENTDESPHRVTGCLRKGAVSISYTLTDENGKMWDLRSRTVTLETHVGHTVTLTGTIPKAGNSSDDSAPQNHLTVTDVKMVRDNCKPQ